MDRAALVHRIDELRAQRNAVILAHNYQLGEVQDVADFVGDSLDLSRRAQGAEADVIVFCGVHFMAETAAILSPAKTVLLPAPSAGCAMADMIDAAQVRAMRADHPGAAVVCYVNTSAEVKAECDACCTSANAAEVVGRVPRDREVIFVPDRNLGANVERLTGRRMILWPGFCPVHDRITPLDVEQRLADHPGAAVVVHPECRPEVVAVADAALSTSGILRFAAETTARTVIVGTEIGIIHRLRRENPAGGGGRKVFVPLTEQAVCPDMKLVTLEKIVACLESMAPRVQVPEEIRQRAERAVLRMTDGGF
jgi:quinolinate synthase